MEVYTGSFGAASYHRKVLPEKWTGGLQNQYTNKPLENQGITKKLTKFVGSLSNIARGQLPFGEKLATACGRGDWKRNGNSDFGYGELCPTPDGG